jgi:hypothetical protein
VVAYWLLNVLFCLSWCLLSFVVWRTKWTKVWPRLTTWMVASAAQAVLTTSAGSFPSQWWTFNVWTVSESLVMVLLGLAAVEAMPAGRAVSLAIAGAVSVPIAFLATYCDGSLYSSFLRCREWLYLMVAIGVGVHVIRLFAKPVPLIPGTYRALCILVVAVATTAGVGLIQVHRPDGLDFIAVRSVYRSIMILCCIRWAMLAPRMRKASSLLCSEG